VRPIKKILVLTEVSVRSGLKGLEMMITMSMITMSHSNRPNEMENDELEVLLTKIQPKKAKLKRDCKGQHMLKLMNQLYFAI